MPAIDKFSSYSTSLTGPLTHLSEVTPDDDTDLPYVTRTIYVGTSGDMEVTTAGGEDVTLANLPVGWHPIRVSRIHATGTTATDIVAGW